MMWVLNKCVVANKTHWQNTYVGCMGDGVVWIRINFNIWGAALWKQDILAGVHGGRLSYIEGEVMLFGQLTVQLQVQDRLSADTLSTLIPSLLLSNTGILYVGHALSTSHLGKWLNVEWNWNIVPQYSLQVWFKTNNEKPRFSPITSTNTSRPCLILLLLANFSEFTS